MLLLRVQAGSHLYGYATATSDDDYFEVHTHPFMIPTRDEPRQVRQTIVDGVDTIQMTLSHFVERAAAGSHQALDAMFAANPETDLLGGFRTSYRAGTDVIPSYIRIITKFAVQGGHRKQRHALRAMLNLHDIMDTGRYTPELTAEQIQFLDDHASLPSPEFMKFLISETRVSLSETFQQMR